MLFWGVGGIAPDNRCERLFFFLRVLWTGLNSRLVTHCCGIICLKIKCVLWEVWGRIYQGEFFLWSIRAGYFADGFWNLAKPQYAVRISVLGFLGTRAHVHLILRPPRLSDVSEVSALGNQGPGPDCNPAGVCPFTRSIQTWFWWLQIRLGTSTWVGIS